MADESLSHDAFLGGRIRAWQPREGYRAGADPVLLAAAVPAQAGETVLELGTGVGVAALCLLARVDNVSVTGVERDAETAALATRNAAENALPLTVVPADLASLPEPVRSTSFDHVMMNPPYFEAGTRASTISRAAARHEDLPLGAWVDCAARRLGPKGYLTVILKADRLPALMSALHGRFGGTTVTPISGRRDRPAGRVIVTTRKGIRAAFRLLPPFVLHSGMRHEKDGDSHSAAAEAVLRYGAPLR